jgi:hypothetical protein
MQEGFAPRFRPANTLYNLYINDTPQITGVNIAVFAVDTCLYGTERKEDYVLIRLQCGLDSMAALYKRCNIKMCENKTLAIPHRIKPPKVSFNKWSEHSLLQIM